MRERDFTLKTMEVLFELAEQLDREDDASGV